jgi:hypothetical protein
MDRIRVSGLYLSGAAGARVGIPESGEVAAPGRVQLLDKGVAFGPLSIRPREDIRVDGLQWFSRSEGGWLDGLWPLSIAGGLGTAAAVGEEPITRRQVLGLAGLVAAPAAIGTADAQDDAPLTRAELDLRHNPGGLTLQAHPGMDNVLDGAISLAGVEPLGLDDGRLVVPPGETGTLEVGLDVSAGLLAGLLNSLDSPEAFEIQLPKRADRVGADSELVATRDETIVGAVEAAGAGETVVTVGGASLAHASELGSDVGTYRIDDGALVVDPGPDAPPSADVRIIAGASTVGELLDDIDRQLQF